MHSTGVADFYSESTELNGMEGLPTSVSGTIDLSFIGGMIFKLLNLPGGEFNGMEAGTIYKENGFLKVKE